jgi:FixJ family two-component response regulator
MDPFEIKDKYQLLPLTQIISPRSSIDERFKEAFIAAISDVNMLKPKKINKLLKDTHAALMEDVKNEKNEDAKEAINSLISLLEENSALQSVVEHYMNRIRKA